MDHADGALRLTLVLIVLIYNYTEAAFKPLNNLFVLLLFSIVQVRMLSRSVPLTTVASRTAAQPRSVVDAHAKNDHETGQNWRPRLR
jgi:hypothetical protein